MRVLVTRPRREAERWCERLRAHGVLAQALPLIDIVPAGGEAVANAWRTLAGCHAAMFVSANAVQGFAAARPAGMAWPAGTRAWSTGPGTRQALLDAGVPADCVVSPAADAPQFDSEALWALVGADAALAGAEVLVVRGADAGGRLAGRPWLAARLTEAGAQVRQIVAYARHLPTWDAATRTHAAAAADDGTLWVFSSSDAVRHLQQLLPGVDWQHGRALATHARIAQAAAAAGFRQVMVVRPELADILASIESLR